MIIIRPTGFMWFGAVFSSGRPTFSEVGLGRLDGKKVRLV
jgi:hypothetical protein